MNDDNNNNDELFRRAAENYPLKTDNPDWEAVLNKMNAGGSKAESEPVTKKRNRNYRFLLLLLLFIPLAIFENKKSSINNQFAGNNNGSENISIAKGDAGKPVHGADLNDNTTQSINQPGAQTQTVNSVEPPAPQTTASKNNNSVSVTEVPDDDLKTSAGNRAYSSKQRSRVKIKNAQPAEDDEIIVRYPVSKERSKEQKNKPVINELVTTAGKEVTGSIKKETDPEDKNIVTQKEIEPTATTGSKEAVPVDKNRLKKKL